MSQHFNQYSGKKVVVFGMGRSGMGAARLLMRCGANVTVCDSGESTAVRERADLLRHEGITVLTGKEAETDPVRYDIGIISPGIEENTPLIANASAKKTPFIGELELAFTLCQCPVIAITGTNGKTTTTELTTRMFQGTGLRTSACGNIGTPMSELVLTDNTWDLLVVEVSSFQLESIKSFHPKVAAWLNFSPNHLDRYQSLQEYRDAKLRIFENQTEEDWVVVPSAEKLPHLKGRKITFSANENDSEADLTLRGMEILHHGKRLLDLSETELRGPHNAANLMAAFACGIALQADLSEMVASIRDYKPPAHRCELVGEKGGVRWINDSKATTIDAMEKAIRSVKGRLILIAGGKDKGFEYAPISSLVRSQVLFAILIGEMQHRIARDWAPLPLAKVESLEAAVTLAALKAEPGCTVLFSPGTSSFDMFRDYIERGELFRRLVEKLPDHSRSSVVDASSLQTQQ